MLLTVEEAIKLDCPAKTYCVNAQCAIYANFAILEQQACSGDKCPAWRWVNKCDGNCDYCEFQDPDPENNDCHRTGYCGLGGAITEKVKF